MFMLAGLSSPIRWVYRHSLFACKGLAILNPAAQRQIRQYARSVTELFKLILEGKRDEFETRVRAAGKFVFGRQKDELLLRDEILDQFSLSGVPKAERKPNSHLSLLGMVDCWWKCDIVPYDHMICSTPVSRPYYFLSLVKTNPRTTAVPTLVGCNRVSLPPTRFAG